MAYSVTSIASDDSSEAEEPVDEQTMRDVAMYLDKLTATTTAHHQATEVIVLEDEKKAGMVSQDDDDDEEDSVDTVPVDAQTMQHHHMKPIGAPRVQLIIRMGVIPV